MGVQAVEFPNGRGHSLRARLELPAQRSPEDEPLTFALFAHCFTCSKDYKAPVYVSRALAKRGIATLRFDFTGLGDSEGTFEETAFSTNVEDVLAAAKWLEEEHGSPRILIGHSMGGAAVLAAATRLESVKLVATLAAPAEPGRVAGRLKAASAVAKREGAVDVTIAGRTFHLKSSFFDDLSSARVRESLKNLDAATLIFHSPDDEIVPPENARLLFAAAPHPKSFVALDGADHLLTDPEDAEFVADLIAAWARRFR